MGQGYETINFGGQEVKVQGHIESCESEISIRIESRINLAATIQIRIESANSHLQLQC